MSEEASRFVCVQFSLPDGWSREEEWQGEQKRTVAEDEMLEALYEEAVKFAERVERGEARLSSSGNNVVPPDPLTTT